MGDLADELLVAAALRGDRGAFARLVDRHRPRTHALARRLLRDPAEAEDVVQEAVLRAYLALGDLREPARFGAWLCGISLNLSRMRLRSARRLEPLAAAAPAPFGGGGSGGALGRLPDAR